MTKFAKGTTGRDIIDSVVEKNSHLNPELYELTRTNPHYFGAVEIGEDPVSLTTIKGKTKMHKSSIICDIINSTENMVLNDGPASVAVIVDGKTHTKPTHPVIIKLIKSCVACSYCPSEDMCTGVSNFVKALMDEANQLVLPLDVYTNGAIQDIVVKELQDYLKELCDRHGIPYQTREPKKESKIERLLRESEG